jgi:diguanylate cyclase (GGDEF)-like protein
VWLLIVGSALLSATLWMLVRHAGAPVTRVHPAVLVVGFVFAELASIQLWVRGEAHTKSLTEAPLAVGLLVAQPLHLLGAAIVGVTIAMAGFRRQRGPKLAFNVVQYSLQVTVGLAVYGALAPDSRAEDPRAWFAAIAATVSAEAVSSILVSAAIYLHAGHADFRAMARTDLTLFPGVVAAGAVGVLAVALSSIHSAALLLLAIVVFTALGAYRGYGTLLRRHHHLQLLQGYSRDIGEAVARDDVVSSALRGAAALLSAERAYFVGVVGDQPGHVLRARFDGKEVTSGVVALDPADPVAAVLGTGEAAHLRRGGSHSPRRDALTHLGIGELLVAPLRADGIVVGALAVGNPSSDAVAFDRNDLALFVTLCDQTALTLQNGRLLGALRSEIAEREHRALHDEVTGIGNRAAFLERVGVRCTVDPTPLAVCVVGLERFSSVNEAFGYERGDESLQLIAARLRAKLRSNDTIARLSGGDFAIAFDEVGDAGAAYTAASALVAAIAEPIAIGGIEVSIGAQAGVALFPDNGNDAGTLLRRADAAFRAAREARRSVELYDEQRDHDAAGRLLLATQLRHAIDRRELTVAYQPKCDLRTGEIRGVEALARWDHPDRGFVPPDEFVLLAEQTGLIHGLTAFVFERALVDRQRWAEAGLDLDLSINVSARDLEHDWLRNEVPGLLAATNCPAARLTLEITETQLMADATRAAAAIQPLHDLGARVAIDDYGTGYSSLAALRALPIDEIKIDKSFVLDMRADDNDAVVVRSTVQLGRALGLEVVAEGVETTVSWHLLREWGCDRAQGYLIARPIAPDKIPAIIAAWQPPEAEGRSLLGLVS